MAGANVPTEGGRAAADATKTQIPDLERVRTAFPQLEVLELIGAGGMGAVFKARQRHLDRWVAVKVLPETLAANPAFAERFHREGRVLARLNHPNIVMVHDFGQAAGFFYLVMEYVDGVNLRQAMRAGRFTPAQALTLVPRICEALQYAHEEGVLHRDIKPENVLLDSRGRVKIADFGIAKLLGDRRAEVTLTSSGASVGTPAYMAPEQIESPGEVDHRADIYSLGVVFYEMLTGELPLGRFAPPSEKTPLDQRIDAIVMRALAKERERRQQTADEVRTEVESVGLAAGVGGGDARAATRPGAPAAASARLIKDEWRPLLLLTLIVVLGFLVADAQGGVSALISYVMVNLRGGPVSAMAMFGLLGGLGWAGWSALRHSERLMSAVGLGRDAKDGGAKSGTYVLLRGTVLGVLGLLLLKVVLAFLGSVGTILAMLVGTWRGDVRDDLSLGLPLALLGGAAWFGLRRVRFGSVDRGPIPVWFRSLGVGLVTLAVVGFLLARNRGGQEWGRQEDRRIVPILMSAFVQEPAAGPAPDAPAEAPSPAQLQRVTVARRILAEVQKKAEVGVVSPSGKEALDAQLEVALAEAGVRGDRLAAAKARLEHDDQLLILAQKMIAVGRETSEEVGRLELEAAKARAELERVEKELRNEQTGGGRKR